MTSRLTIEYDGSEFAGWARQPGGVRTVQAELERALAVLSPGPVGLTVAGRTDRGVHAWGQVASYEAQPVPASSLNALLPADIAVVHSTAAPDGFDARRDCTSRAYCFRVLARRQRTAISPGHCLHCSHTIDLEALHACAELLAGTHDFTAFTPSDSYHVRFDRHVHAAFWKVSPAGRALPGPAARSTAAAHAAGLLLEFWIEADSFMRHMNRALVGTMLQVARGRRSVNEFAALLEGRPREAAGPTAPARGLHFAGAGYAGRRLLAPGSGLI